MEELYRLKVNNGDSEGLSLAEIAIRARIEEVVQRMHTHRAWNILNMSIDDICTFRSGKTFDDAEKALAEYAMMHGVSALVNKVVKMTIDEMSAMHRYMDIKQITSVGPTCTWCESKDCANCKYVRTPTGDKIRWRKTKDGVKDF